MTAAIDITAAQRKTLMAILRRYIPGVLVWAYGSRVKFTARPNSDLDLVVFTVPAQRLAVSNLKDDLAESNLPFLVDLHIWDEVPETFHEIIRKEYVVLQEAKDIKRPDRWKTLPLEDCMAAIIDYRGKTPEKTTFGVPLVTAKVIKGGRIERPDEFIAEADFDAWMRRGMPERGDIVMTTEAPLGEVAQLDGTKVALAQRVITLRGKPDLLDNTFLKFLLQSSEVQEELHSRGTGTTVVGIRQSELRKVSLTLPPLAEQKAIAAVLGALDDKIELNRRMNATLEAMARALFQSWFVDFDPVRAKLDARPPAGLDPATAALFPDSFQDSELGHIPHGWKATTLGACIGFRSGFSFKSQDWQESGVPVVKIGSVKPGIIDLTQVSYVSEAIAHQAARYRLTTGDMLIGMTGYVGEVGLVPPSDNPPLLNQRVGKFVMQKPGTESLAFWYCTTRQPEFRAFVEARSHGTAQANVSGEAIMAFPLVAPSPEILDAFNRECQPMLDRILSNHAESRTLATLRDTLLPKLLSGDVSVGALNPDQRKGAQ